MAQFPPRWVGPAVLAAAAAGCAGSPPSAGSAGPASPPRLPLVLVSSEMSWAPSGAGSDQRSRADASLGAFRDPLARPGVAEQVTWQRLRITNGRPSEHTSFRWREWRLLAD
jgi:hypothetical protein